MKTFDLIVIGSGASGFFTAINVAEQNPNLSVLILEKGKEVLQKVKISGGGRCNVTHAEFIPNELTKNYPRGEKELKGPFHTFMTGDTMQWFEDRGVNLKIEDDGRIFPESDNSQTIIDCFLAQAQKYGVKINTQALVTNFNYTNNTWIINTKEQNYQAKKIVIATGSNPKIWNFLQKLDIKTSTPVPSLFTFNTENSIKKIPGTVHQVSLSIIGTNLKSEGPLLVTHWGFSGPAILKLSAWGARILKDLNYKFTLQINWTKFEDFESCRDYILDYKNEHPKQTLSKNPLYHCSKKLWLNLVLSSGIGENQKWADCNKKQLTNLANQLTRGNYNINGKSTFKEEFVTAGGIDLKEIDFKTFQSKKLPNCYFVGEALNIDAITGGFNFQNAWTGGWIAAKNIVMSNE